MKENFGLRSDGQMTHLYTISQGSLSAKICDQGAMLYSLLVPDAAGNLADVVLGYRDPDTYCTRTTYFGATVGRNANRVGGAGFTVNGKTVKLDANDNGVNNLHSGFSPFHSRMWQVVSHEESSIILELHSPSGDQGFPGNATVRVTYALEHPATLRISYDALCDEDTVFNMTNHSYFNMAGHHKPEKAMDQWLTMPARHFTPADAMSIPTGEIRNVAGTPMDFRTPKPIGRDIDAQYDALGLQSGYDHNFEAFGSPCAILTDPDSGRTMAISTDCPGIQLYAGNFMDNEPGKDGVVYPRRGGVALETQFYPDSVNKPQWKQPFVKAGTPYHSETCYRFSW